jgi:hypothetical protein
MTQQIPPLPDLARITQAALFNEVFSVTFT